MIRVIGPVILVTDGYGLPFDSGTHWGFVLPTLRKYEQSRATPPPPPIEPQWKDYPAGRSKCPPLFEDAL